MNIWKRKWILVSLSVMALFLILLIRMGAHFFQNKDSILERSLYSQVDVPVFPYALTNPSKKFKLPHRLDEISGLSYFAPDRLACIQDEKGMIYVFDIEKGDVAEKYRFGDANDYEDIQIVGKTAYILQSDGTILIVEDFKAQDPKVERCDTRLSNKNNAEGLAFDAESNSLFIACKDSPFLNKKRKALKGKRVVYRFDLQTKKICKKPVFIIDMEDLKDSGGYSSGTTWFSGLISIFDPRKGDGNFRPSGIAIHPKTNNFYIISSSSADNDKMLIVLNREGDIVAAKRLDTRIFRQPEGICFNPEGDLFISNESRGGRATILQFDYKQ